jgi:predicted  nucleic acid-binding Zn-ribbon protein
MSERVDLDRIREYRSHGYIEVAIPSIDARLKAVEEEAFRLKDELAEAQRTITAQKDLIRDWQCVYTDALHAKNSAVSELESENAALHSRIAELESRLFASDKVPESERAGSK